MMANGGVIDTMESIVIQLISGWLWQTMKFAVGIDRHSMEETITIVGVKTRVYPLMDQLVGKIIHQ